MSENNYKEFWQFSMNQLSEEYKKNGQENEFKLWFNIEYIEDTIDTINVSVSSDFLWQQMVKKGNIRKIQEKLEQLTGQKNIVLNPIIKNSFETLTNKSSPEQNHTEKNPDNDKKKNDSKSPEKETKIELLSTSSVQYKNTALNEKYTFDSFIPGTNLQFAYNVAFSVAENPGLKANPILLYGCVGLGKTHLMQAIGNKIFSEKGEKLKICYIQAESFTNEFTNNIRNKTPAKFQSKYRKLDVLLLDDIHFLQKKEGVQNELFYTFEALHKNNSQMIFTCDRPLREIREMTDRLVSRLSSGMTLDLQPPNYETRKAILYKKLDILKKSLPEEVIDYIAETVETNIRDLEAALNKILGYSEFMDNKITVEIARQQLKDIYMLPNVGNISIENIQKVIADNYQISVQELRNKSRAQKYVIPRHIALYISKELTEYTFTELGNEFGGKDHSTVMHACDNIKDKIKTDSSFAQKVNALIKEIKEYKN
ncbi:MAG: chromosomal replication initiator protein DnaA [Treponema sp.]